MKKVSKSFMFLGMILFLLSCEEQIAIDQVEETSLEITDPKSQDKLAIEISSNSDFQEFVANNAKLIARYNDWLNELSDDNRKEYLKKIQDAVDEGRAPTVDMSFINQNRLEAFYAKQKMLVDKVTGDFRKELSGLKQDEKVLLLSSAISKVRRSQVNESANSRVAADTDPCHEGYNACSWSCYDNGGAQACYDACWAGYLACKAKQDQ